MRTISLQSLLVGYYVRCHCARPATTQRLSQLRLGPLKIELDLDCSACDSEHIFLCQFGVLFALVVGDILGDVEDAVGAVYLVLVEYLPDGDVLCYVCEGELEVRLKAEHICR